MEQQADRILAPQLADFLALSAAYLLAPAPQVEVAATPVLDDVLQAGSFCLSLWNLKLMGHG